MLFNGVAYGVLLFIMSVGLSVTMGMMNFVNLAQASFSMLGGYVMVAVTQQLGIPFLASLPIAFVVVGICVARDRTPDLSPFLRHGRSDPGAADDRA